MRMNKTRKKIKSELKETAVGADSFDEVIHRISIYIFDNFKLRNKKIDSEKILKDRRKK